MKFDTSRTGERKILRYDRKVHRCLNTVLYKINLKSSELHTKTITYFLYPFKT